MDTTSQNVVPKTYIAEWIKLDFFNNSNLKTDIQNRISVTIETDFINALNDMRGDNKNGFGISFSDITRLALAYFYNEIFTDKIKDNYYTLETVKGFLDANNLTSYTAIHEINIRFYELKATPYFKHCWLIIQSAWFFNSEFFGHHQHIDYLNYYIKTGQKLPLESYNFDRIYLEKKYNDIDNSKTKKIPIDGFTLVSQWYYGILFLMCKELQLSTKHFNVSLIDNREYNPMPKTSRQLRPLAPFKIIECDIKSAWASFLDVETGATLKDYVYNNLMLSKGITRSEAKILFNTVCNSGKYKTQQETISFFLDCGYTQKECECLIKFTHNPEKKFYSLMTEYEALAILIFISQNDLQRGARLHDALLFIDNKIKPTVLKVHPNCDFGYKELNKPVINESFIIDSKRLTHAYINSIPKGFNLITKHEARKSTIKGFANGFKFYTEKYNYISASFNLNNYHEIKDKEPKEFFNNQCEIMLNTLFYLNNRNLKPIELFTILKHIRQYGNFIFNVRSYYLRLIKYQCNKKEIRIKAKDFDIIEPKQWVKRIDFLNDLGKAKMMVNIDNNHYNLFALLQERILNNDYNFLTEAIIKGKRTNNSLTYALINKFNLLVTGRQRKERNGFKKDYLYNSSIKEVLIKSLSLKPQQQNAFIKKGIAKYESELSAMNRLINNRKTAEQLFLLVCQLAEQETDLKIVPNIFVINKLKTELYQSINQTICTNIMVGGKKFDLMFIKEGIKKIVPITDLEDVFDTDLSNCIFNHIEPDEAFARGEIFLSEYLEFNKLNEVKERIKYVHKPKEIYRLPEIDF
jgi:hypothetical protein